MKEFEEDTMCSSQTNFTSSSFSSEHFTSVIQKEVRKNEHVIWLPLHRTSENHFFGPVFLVYKTAVGFELKSVGQYISPSLRVDISFFRIGSHDVFGLTSIDCPLSSPHMCEKKIQLFVKNKNKLQSQVLITQNGKCTSLQSLFLQTQRTFQSAQSFKRHIELSSEIKKERFAIVVQEQLRISLSPSSKTLFDSNIKTRSIHSSVQISSKAGYLILSKPSMLESLGEFRALIDN